jgi:hypothetical protein
VIAAAAPVAAPEPLPSFNQEWKTRLVWSPEELAQVEAERARVIEEVRKATGRLPGQESGASSTPAPPAPPAPRADAPAPARKTEFIGRDQLQMPPTFAEPAADVPPPMPPAPAPPSPAPPTPAAAPARPAASDMPATSAFRPAADLPPTFMDAPPAFAEAPPPPPVAPPPPPPEPAGAPRATSAFRPSADLPPAFADLPETAQVVVPAAPRVFGLRGAAGDFTLAEGSSIAGRQEGVPIFISDRQVSRHHAVITVQQGRVTIEDKQSANGTFVNGARLTAPRVLAVGDQVKFGDLLFTVVAKN